MSRPVGMSLKTAGIIMIGSLVVGIMIGLVLPKDTPTAFSAADTTSLRGGGVDRRLVDFDNVVGRVGHQEGEKAPIKFEGDAMSNPKAEWPHQQSHASRGNTLWGPESEDDIWGVVEKLWPSQGVSEVFAGDFADADYTSYEMDPVIPENFSFSYTDMVTLDSEEVEIEYRRSLRDWEPSPFEMDAFNYWDLELHSAYSFSFEYL